MNRLISVVIPMYNTEKYISDCLDSLMEQTYSNFEAIVINDGSTDRCGDIVKEYMRKESRFKLIEQKNQGASAARNLGIELSRGDYLYFLDSDDYIHKNTFQSCMSCFEDEEVDMVTFDAQCIFEEDYLNNRPLDKINKTIDFYDRKGSLNDVYIIDIIEFLRLSALNGKIRGNMCLCMIKSNTVKNRKIVFDNRITYYEDYLFYYLLSKYITKVRYINEKFYYRRMTGNSLVTKSNISKKMAEDLFYCVDFLENDYPTLNDKEKIINRLFKKEFIKTANINREKSLYEGNGIAKIENDRWNIFYSGLDKYRQVREGYEFEYNKTLSDIELILNEI